jgi:cytochrome P450
MTAASRAQRVPRLGGSPVEVSIWGIHHSPAVWPEPDVFDPRRFDVPQDSSQAATEMRGCPSAQARAHASACRLPCSRFRS